MSLIPGDRIRSCNLWVMSLIWGLNWDTCIQNQRQPQNQVPKAEKALCLTALLYFLCGRHDPPHLWDDSSHSSTDDEFLWFVRPWGFAYLPSRR